MDSQYFAAKPSKDCVRIVLEKARSWTNVLEANGYLRKLRMSWAAYHGCMYKDFAGGHQITFGGDEGELTQLPVNHIRNLAVHSLNMVTATRPAMEARAINTDYKSLTQTILANGLLDWYMREKRLERVLKLGAEYAIVLGSGFVKMGWNATRGELYDFNEELQTPIYEGDVEFQVFSPFDVIVDSTKENALDHDWIIVRSWKNKYDLAAKYPEYADNLVGLETKSQTERWRFTGINSHDETDDVALWEFFHRRSESVPDGRYMMFVDNTDIPALFDGPLPYRSIPVHRISGAEILGTPYGYTSLFDLLPLQDALNMLYSTVLSNQAAFGVQSVVIPRGAEITISQLASGLNCIEADTSRGKIEPLNLTHTPEEIFNFMALIEKTMETLSGINSVARGDPSSSLKSGAALAMVQSQAIQFMSGLQASYVALIEEVGTGLINILKDYAAVPRVAAIAGRQNRVFMKEFKGDDLESVNRVVVDMANPLSRTTAGRVQMAEQMLQMGAIRDAQQYFTVINTGKLDVMMEGTQNELMLIKGENEKMMDGVDCPVLAIDDHASHIMEHKAILADPDMRQNQQLAGIVLSHIQEHINALRNADPDLLKLVHQNPLGPPPGSPPPGNLPPGMLPPPGAGNTPPPPSPQNPVLAPPQPGLAGITQSGNRVQGPGIEQGVHMPNMPHPPKPFEHLPTNPEDLPTH